MNYPLEMLVTFFRPSKPLIPNKALLKAAQYWKIFYREEVKLYPMAQVQKDGGAHICHPMVEDPWWNLKHLEALGNPLEIWVCK